MSKIKNGELDQYGKV